MVKIYRKVSPWAKPKVTAAEKKRLLLIIEAKCRVERPAMLDLFFSGDFYRLEALPGAVVKSKADRILDHADAGWELPESDFGRGDTPSVESVRLWVSQWIAGEKSGIPLVNDDEVAVVVE